MEQYKRIIAKEIAQLTEIQDGYVEGSNEWKAYEDMLDAIMDMWANRLTCKAD